MEFDKKKIINGYKNLFSSQDSKFFIYTASKLTVIPILSFCIVFYSLWTIMEMNFNFFVANGFNSGEVFKEAFYDSIFIGVSDYVPYFFIVTVGVFLTGLFVSWLTLRSFETIEAFSRDAIEDYSEDFEVSGLNKSKLINQTSRIFFKYLQICQRDERRPRFKLPKQLDHLKHPPFDKVFLLQYTLIVSALCLVTNIILFTFTNELYQELVNEGLELLEANRVVTNFLKSQESVLFNIYSIAIGVNVVLYILISKSIIKSVDGVSFGFARDMLRVVKGAHDVRLAPRYTDPGKNVAAAINAYLDQVFPFIEEEDHTTLEEASEKSFQDLNNYLETDHLPDEDDIDGEDDDESEYESGLPIDEHESNVVEMQRPPQEIPGEPEDLPPAFIEEKQVANGDKVFHITTPEGLKVENVDADLLLKIVKETKK